MFAHILGESVGLLTVPFSGAAELYNGAGIGEGFIGRFKDDIDALKLDQRFARTLLIKELTALAGVYNDIMAKYYQLDSKDRKLFEAGGASAFKDFLLKVRRILQARAVANDLSDVTKSFTNKRIKAPSFP